MMLEFERDPTFRMDDVHDLTRPEVRERIMTRVNNRFKVHNLCVFLDSEYDKVYNQ